ncbi:MAG: putative lipid II flippase FtsW [Acidimicrobiia bacterium]|nr:putative lipid II flippase FtsW [Acidimicrobiia bacterium]NNL29255.1 putative lipid II flippase FtsW [Acidimicrobiia bacterium]
MTVTSITRKRAEQVASEHEVLTRRRSLALLLAPVALLLLIGLGALLSASSVESLERFGDSLYYFRRQTMWLGAGLIALVISARVPYRLYQRWAIPILAVSLIGLVSVLLVGIVGGGSRRWLAIGPVTIQPSEFSKFAVIVFLSAVMIRKGDRANDYRHFFGPVIASVGISGLLLLSQPDLGTAMMLSFAALAVLLVSGAPLRYVGGLIAAGSLVVLISVWRFSYQFDRIMAFVDPFADATGDGYQPVQAMYALGTGGWFGIGLGESRARWAYLPEAHTDFIFAIIGEEMGLIGALGVILLFATFTVGGIVIAIRAKDLFGRCLAVGIVAWIGGQAIINIGAVTGALPITGISLPFVSSGGSALIVSLSATGVLINIARSDS